MFLRYAQTPSAMADAIALPDNTDPGLLKAVYARVLEKLEKEPVEDYRIDFEDGYGFRSDDEEDAHAVACAMAIGRGMEDASLPSCLGFRVKALAPQTARRSLRTLDIMITTLARCTGGALPSGFVVALPKVVDPIEVSSLAHAIWMIEDACNIPEGSVMMELMIETPSAIISPDGTCPLPQFIEAAGERCVAAHFGAYDYTAACDIAAAHQSLHHDACRFARHMMQAALAGSGVRLVDGATTVLSIEPNRASEGSPGLTREQEQENELAVHAAWKLNYHNIRESLEAGFYQGWDLHPGQLPMRYAATYLFFLQALEEASMRLKGLIDRAARATRIGNVFDDAATGRGLLNFFRRALDCSAIDEGQLKCMGLTGEEIQQRSFMSIIGEARTGGE